MIAGALDCLQIWRPSRYRTMRGEDDVTQPARVWIDDDDTTDEMAAAGEGGAR